MAGGYSRGRRGATLGERTADRGSDSTAAVNPAQGDAAVGDGIRADPARAPGDVPATACWLEAPAQTPGTVLAWRRDAEAGWQALVVAWVPADRVRPRSPDPGSA